MIGINQLLDDGKIVEEFSVGVINLLSVASQVLLEKYFIKQQAGFDLEALKEEKEWKRVTLWAMHLLVFYASSQWLMRFMYAKDLLPTTKKDKQGLNFNDFQDLCLLLGDKPFNGAELSILNHPVDASSDGVLRATWVATLIKQRPSKWLDLALIYKLQALIIWYKKLQGALEA